MMDLYFIALIPHSTLRDVIRSLKEEIKESTGAKKALNSPAHITLQRPFRRDAHTVEKWIGYLQSFAAMQKPFPVKLSGFGCFEPRVIFVNVCESIQIRNIHSELNTVLLQELYFEKKEINTTIQPHITIATRDLSKSDFYKIWPKYKERKFEAEFIVKSLFLLKHNGKFWDVFHEISFKK